MAGAGIRILILSALLAGALPALPAAAQAALPIADFTALADAPEPQALAALQRIGQS